MTLTAFTAGSVRVISTANDDVTYQDGGNSYVRGLRTTAAQGGGSRSVLVSDTSTDATKL